MEPENQPQEQPLPPADGQPANTSEPVVPPPVGGNRKFAIIVGGVVALLLLVLGAYFLVFNKKDEAPADANTSQQAQTSDQGSADEVAELTCEEDFTKFEGDNFGLHFCYPAAWGNAEMADGSEKTAEHLTAGDEKVISFSKNDTVVAGLRSKNWTHNDAHHDGGGQAGYISFSEASKPKDDIKDTQVLVDTESQLAYVMPCAEFCSSDETRYVQLQFTTKFDHDSYEVITFYQAGPEYGDEYSDDLLGFDYDKAATDAHTLFPKTDARFTTLQKVVNSVTN